MRTKILLFGIAILLGFTAYAQKDTVTNRRVLDGAYARENNVLRKPVGYVMMREADAMYSKKVLRYIDLNERRNHPLYFPTEAIEYLETEGLQPQRARRSLYALIKDIGVKQRELPCFSYTKRSLDLTQWYKTEIDSTGIDKIGTYEKVEQRTRLDIYGDLVPYDTTINVEIDNSDVKAFLMWEEWVFDKQRSVLDVRIIALAPLAITPNIGGGMPIGLFWIHYPHYRGLFATNEVYNNVGNKNDAARMSFDDLFFKRLFSSFIYAETNEYDNRLIEQYLMGIDAIREGERIQAVIAQYEHDQWEY
ncbi:MAG: gliding motility protein GldN [Bacteroidales bacterium]|nr:gliding motility protein GldN [Bacteroidales bacterium]